MYDSTSSTFKIKYLKLIVTSIVLICVSITESVQAQQVTKQITVQLGQKYLNFPIRGWSGEADYDHKMMRIIHEGEVLDEFSISLANSSPDWWGFFPLDQYQGETLTVELDNPSGKDGLKKVYASESLANQDQLYKERYRQQIHFSNKRGWNNDPNGMIYFSGKWHLYFQYNPYGWGWGNMHWGHAVSEDLVHWEELPAALYSPDHDHMAFSGGATVDKQNTTGFRRNGVDPLIATYTRTGSGEHLALSYDGGKTFDEFVGNPVVEHEGRDPKVIWYEPGNHWVMIVYDEDPAHSRQLETGGQARFYQHAFYTSPDMKDWTYQSGVHTMFECPELFELPVEGESGSSKWVMYDGDGKYFVGSFDGKEFTKEQELKEYDHGGAFYASQTFSNVPEEDGRRIQIGWFQTETPYMPFNQSMTFPTELKLRRIDDEYTLTPTPVEEIKNLHKETYQAQDMVIEDSTFSSPIRGDQLHLIAEIDRGSARQFGLNINGYQLNYNRLRTDLNDTFYPIGNIVKFEIIVDKVGMEIFIDDGVLYYALEYNSVDNEKELNITSSGGKIVIKKLRIHELESIWNVQKDEK